MYEGYDAEHIEQATRMNERSIRDAIDKRYNNKSKYERKYPHSHTDNTDIANLKK